MINLEFRNPPEPRTNEFENFREEVSKIFHQDGSEGKIAFSYIEGLKQFEITLNETTYTYPKLLILLRPVSKYLV